MQTRAAQAVHASGTDKLTQGLINLVLRFQCRLITGARCSVHSKYGYKHKHAGVCLIYGVPMLGAPSMAAELPTSSRSKCECGQQLLSTMRVRPEIRYRQQLTHGVCAIISIIQQSAAFIAQQTAAIPFGTGTIDAVDVLPSPPHATTSGASLFGTDDLRGRVAGDNSCQGRWCMLMRGHERWTTCMWCQQASRPTDVWL